jgi:hypothetical protein
MKVHSKSLRLSVSWLIGNAIFGLSPLIFLSLINPALKDQPASHEIKVLINGGTILFVCCALMGAVWVDIMIDQVKFGSTTFFAISAAPFAMLSIIWACICIGIYNCLKSSCVRN